MIIGFTRFSRSRHSSFRGAGHYSRKDIELRSAKGSFRLVLDGQQRITSLYRALLGIDSVWFVCKHPHEIDGEFEKASCEQLLSEFAGQENPDRLSLRMADVFAMMENNYFEDEIRTKFFQDLKISQGLNDSAAKEAFRRYLTVCRKLQDMLKADKLLSYYLLNTTTEKFSLFFERSNSKGIQLSFTDILAAKLYDGFNLRESMEIFQEAHPSYELNREVLVRAVAFLVSKGKEIDRNYILNTLSSVDFNTHWEHVTDLYRKAVDFLYENSFIISQQWMPYDNMLLPVMFFVDTLGGDFSQMTEEQHRVFRAWYWCSVFSERYSASTNEVTTMDANVLVGIASGKLELEKGYVAKFKVLLDAADEIPLVNKKGSVLYTGLLNLVNYDAGGLSDWKNSSKLSLTSKLEDHHIFPKDYLRKLAEVDEDVAEAVDSVANRTLIPKLTNIKIGSRPPSAYLKELAEKNLQLKTALEQHRIPEMTEEGLYDDAFKDFLKDRAELMFQAVGQHVLKGREFLVSMIKAKDGPSPGG